MSKLTFVRSLFALTIPLALLGAACGPVGEGDTADKIAEEELTEGEQALCIAGPTDPDVNGGWDCGTTDFPSSASYNYTAIPDAEDPLGNYGTCERDVTVQIASWPTAFCGTQNSVLIGLNGAVSTDALTSAQCATAQGTIKLFARNATTGVWSSIYSNTTSGTYSSGARCFFADLGNKYINKNTYNAIRISGTVKPTPTTYASTTVGVGQFF